MGFQIGVILMDVKYIQNKLSDFAKKRDWGKVS